jgi:hypothetical protein
MSAGIIERKSFKNQLTEEQINALELYYTKVNPLPRHKAKVELAKVHKIDPYLLNKWFQSRRNKDKAGKKKVAPEIRKEGKGRTLPKGL